MDWTKIVCVILNILVALICFAIISIMTYEMNIQDKQIGEIRKTIEDFQKTNEKICQRTPTKTLKKTLKMSVKNSQIYEKTPLKSLNKIAFLFKR